MSTIDKNGSTPFSIDLDTDEGNGTPDLDTLLDIEDFNERIVGAYNDGTAEKGLPADISVARSLIGPGTAVLRDFSYIAPEIPEFIPDKCVGCMDCVTECPDTAILGKIATREDLEKELAKTTDPDQKAFLEKQFTETAKYHKNFERKGKEGAYFGIFIDPTKCKGCAECVEVCGDKDALKMIDKTPENLEEFRSAWKFHNDLPESPREYLIEKSVQDMMLTNDSLLYLGGAGSCMGCGEATALRMMLAATGFTYGPDSVGLVASTGCNTVYTSTYPYNPYTVPWTNSLFENSPADAMGVRARWNQMGWQDKKLWVIGGDGAMLDIGFQALSRMLMSGMNINVIVLDTQVYSNTGGQASTATFMGQNAKMASHGSVIPGKTERRKELGQICMMHPDVFVAQTICALPNHFYKAIMAANEYEGPSVISVYTTCQPEHGVADHMAGHQAKLAMESRAFPIFIHDPREGERIKERLSLRGNPAINDDWYTIRRTGETIDFTHFARTEGRFSKHFDAEGNPSKALLAAQDDRLQNWRMLQEMAGII
ncbi:MAG: thiamine pyrophosphate-dependent enzyme [Candidatus Latescibacteria bacterium]|jgi:pyruvate/2-oxoacid:ferredoxin oxidoreductase beta subunit/Pyruvate/2-oxoacid:ferredoxin oxidoreductase delta subunit|nr:thiamine pyrophosphate-dependent enzyme [Candidatus Latescibacterota bacterium]